MKILLIATFYPPRAFGGAEDCAKSFAEWAAAHGHEVRVVTAARERSEIGLSQEAGGVEVSVIGAPHIYAPANFYEAPKWQKPIYHAQDIFTAGSRDEIGRQIDAFAPDVALVHYIQGLGYRSVEAIAERGIPIVFVLHDLGLACIRMSMFKRGRDCGTQCMACRITSEFKETIFRKAAQRVPVAFISPSQANLDTLDQFFPVKSFPNRQILNTKAYPAATVARSTSGQLRLLYAGKLDEPKGVPLLLDAVSRVAPKTGLSLTLAGNGPLREQILADYGDAPWFRYLGFITQQELADAMAGADLLCVPSLWQENSPGVVIQALAQGLPVMAHDRGGLGELVQNGENGILIDQFDAEAWIAQFERLAGDPSVLEQLRAGAYAGRERFAQDSIGEETIAFIDTIRHSPAGQVKPR